MGLRHLKTQYNKTKRESGLLYIHNGCNMKNNKGCMKKYSCHRKNNGRNKAAENFDKTLRNILQGN